MLNRFVERFCNSEPVECRFESIIRERLALTSGNSPHLFSFEPSPISGK